MHVVPFIGTACFLVETYVPRTNPQTGGISRYFSGHQWLKFDLWDPVQRVHARNLYLCLWPSLSQADRNEIFNEWAHLHRAQAAKEAQDRKNQTASNEALTASLQTSAEIREATEAQAQKQKASNKNSTTLPQTTAHIRHAREANEAMAQQQKASLQNTADIRHAREATEATAQSMKAFNEELTAALQKVADEDEAKKKAMMATKKRAAVEQEKKRKFAAMLEESEGVAANIAKAEKRIKAAAAAANEGGKEKKAHAAWMDVVMG